MKLKIQVHKYGSKLMIGRLTTMLKMITYQTINMKYAHFSADFKLIGSVVTNISDDISIIDLDINNVKSVNIEIYPFINKDNTLLDHIALLNIRPFQFLCEQSGTMIVFQNIRGDYIQTIEGKIVGIEY
jgi:hypothetical protein